MKNRRKKKKESGQAMVEFAFVLPLFLLLIMGIIDFGYLFYNYIGVENAARNAARIACVEYTDCCTKPISNSTHVAPKTGAEATFALSAFYDADGAVKENTFTEYENHIAKVVKDTLPMGVKANFTTVTFQVEYSYDTSPDVAQEGFDVGKRYKGDVTVTIKGDANVLTPVLGVTADHMKKTLTSTSTFKVEKQPSSGVS